MKASRLFSACLLLFSVCRSYATIIVVIYTPDGYWIGADSVRTIGDNRTQTVCKVHLTKFGWLLKSGNTVGTRTDGTLYSTDKEVEDLLSTTTLATEFKERLRLVFKRDIEAEMVYVLNDPTVTIDNLESTPFQIPLQDEFVAELSRSIVLLPSNPADGSGELLQVEPMGQPVSRNWLGQVQYKYWAPSVSGWHPIQDLRPIVNTPNGIITFPPSVHMFGHPVQYDRPDDWVLLHPQEALTEILKKAHDQDPKGVGPPYTIVHVRKSKTQETGYEFVAKAPCPSWNEGISSEVGPMEFWKNPISQ